MSDSFNRPTRVFVSHISEEAKVAALLKEMVEDDFLGLVELFTSSDVGSIHAGENWLAAVKEALNDAAVVVVLCSRASVQRPWVQFEVGAAWMKDVPIIPVCHSGLKVVDLQMPLSLRQGCEIGTERGIELLYTGMARALKMKAAPRPKDLPARLREIAALEEQFRRHSVQQFERYIDIIVPPPGRLETESIPDDARIESDEDSLELFGFIPGVDRTWRDIVASARRKPDVRWLGELQRCIHLAGKNELFRPVQAIYHTDSGSFQPQLAKKEGMPGGASRFHVHFVETVVAPLSEVQNDFGLLATMLRLGLRFRYEVIEKFRRLVKPATGKAKQTPEQLLTQLRSAIQFIENDALSRGAQNIDRDAVAALFDSDEDQQVIAEVQDAWDESRALLFRDDPVPSQPEMADVISRMRWLNFRFMEIGTRRYHEMVSSRWDGG
jgi:hypothetical protein